MIRSLKQVLCFGWNYSKTMARLRCVSIWLDMVSLRPPSANQGNEKYNNWSQLITLVTMVPQYRGSNHNANMYLWSWGIVRLTIHFTIASYNQSTILYPVHHLLRAEMVLPFSTMFWMPREESQSGSLVSIFLRVPCEISIPWIFFSAVIIYENHAFFISSILQTGIDSWPELENDLWKYWEMTRWNRL